MKTLYTLGTSNRTEEDFVEILNAHGVSCLIDVRSYPKSKLPWFSRDALERSMEANGILYRWLGPELGGMRKGGYEAYVLTEDFAKGIDLLESIASQGVCAVVCAERFPWKCHRRWIAREMARRGWRVVHVLEKDKLWEPKA